MNYSLTILIYSRGSPLLERIRAIRDGSPRLAKWSEAPDALGCSGNHFVDEIICCRSRSPKSRNSSPLCRLRRQKTLEMPVSVLMSCSRFRQDLSDIYLRRLHGQQNMLNEVIFWKSSCELHGLIYHYLRHTHYRILLSEVRKLRDFYHI